MLPVGIFSLGLFLDDIGLERSDDEPETPKSVEVKSGHGAPTYEHGPQTRMRRAPVRAVASVTWEGGPERIYGTLANISPEGCLLKTETTIEPGTDIDLEIAAIGTVPRLEVNVTAEVRHTTELDGRQAYGIEFTGIDDENATALKKLYNKAAGG